MAVDSGSEGLSENLTAANVGEDARMAPFDQHLAPSYADYEIGELPVLKDGSAWLGPRSLALGLIALIVLAVTAFGVVAINERNASDEPASAVVDDPVSGIGIESSQNSIATPPGARPSDEDVDPADMMSIQIEPETPVSAEGEARSAATAIVRADGLLYLEGAFPSQVEADGYIDGLAKVFGRENIVESYAIDPAAPLPTAADVSLDKPVLFESGTATIDPSYIPFLEACGDVLKLNPHITMSIAAFTDSVGAEDFNLELSQQRAKAIYDFYRGLDIEDTQLLSVGYGESEPVGDNATEAGREQNRRAMLQLLDVMADETSDISE